MQECLMSALRTFLLLLAAAVLPGGLLLLIPLFLSRRRQARERSRALQTLVEAKPPLTS